MKKKIVFLITRADDFGGAQAHVLIMAEALNTRGNNAVVMAGGEGFLSDALKEKNIRFIKVNNLVHPIKPHKDIMAYLEIKELLKKEKPDLLATHSNKAGFLGRLAARKLKIPVTFTSHGFLFAEGRTYLKRKFYLHIEMLMSRLTDRVIAVSESEMKLAVDSKAVPADKVRVIHNGLPDIGPGQIAIPAAEPPQLVMVARFAEPKDHRTLIRALSGLIDQSWNLVLVGDGPLRNDIERLVDEEGLEDRVAFMGSRKDVPDILAKSQLFILSSKREGFPLSTLEGMRAGMPVLASDVGGVSEAVVDGENGYLCTADDIESLRTGIFNLISNSDLRQRMGKKGRNRFLEKFTSGVMVEKTMLVYDELLS